MAAVTAVFVVIVFAAAFYCRRRNAVNKQIGHLSGASSTQTLITCCVDYDGEVNRALTILSDPKRVSLYPRRPLQVYTVFYTCNQDVQIFKILDSLKIE